MQTLSKKFQAQRSQRIFKRLVARGLFATSRFLRWNNISHVARYMSEELVEPSVVCSESAPVGLRGLGGSEEVLSVQGQCCSREVGQRAGMKKHGEKWIWSC